MRIDFRKLDRLIMLSIGGLIIYTAVLVIPWFTGPVANPFLNIGLIITGLYVTMIPWLENPGARH